MTIKTYMAIAEAVAHNSKCTRRQVGAVIVQDTRVISTGYNGTPSGSDNCCEDDKGSTKPSVIHAEANAILFAAKSGIPTDKCLLVVTMSPCIECAKMIAQSGIKSVIFRDEYQNLAGLRLLKKLGIKVAKMED